MTYFETSYILPRFFKEAGNVLEENALRGCEGIWREKLYNEEFEPVFKLMVPTSQIDQLTSVLGSMEQNAAEYIERLKKFTQTSRSLSYQITFRKTDELRNIKIQYVDRFLETITGECKEIANGSANIHELIKHYEDPETFRKLKVSVIDTTIPYYMTARDLIRLDSGMTFSGSTEMIRTKVIPFLVEFYNVRLKSKDKVVNDITHASFREITISLKDTFGNFCDELEAVYKALLKSTDGVYHPVIKRYFYTVYTVILNLEKYVFGSYIRMMTSYIKNMNEVQKFVSYLEWKTGDVGSIVECGNGEDALDYTILNPYKLLEDVVLLEGIVQQRCTRAIPFTYDDMAYDFVRMNIQKMMSIMKQFIKLYESPEHIDDPITDIIEYATENIASIDDMFSTERARNMNYMKTVSFVPEYVLGELTAFQRRIPQIGKVISNFMDVVTKVSNKISLNPNNTYSNAVRNKECVDYLGNFVGRLNLYAKELYKAYGDRLKCIADQYGTTNHHDTEIMCEPDRFFADGLASTYDIPMEESCEDLERMDKMYRDIYLRKVSGFYFEGDEGQKGDGNKPQPQGSGDTQQNKSSNDQKENKDSTKPVVHDGDNGGDNKQNNDSTNNNQNNDNNKESGDSKMSKLSDCISKIIDTVTEFFENKGAKKKNLGFIDYNKDFLLSRSYVNTSINILPYLANGKLVAPVEKVINIAANLDDHSLKTLTTEQIQQKVLTPLNITNIPNENLEEAITKAMKVGKKKLEDITIGNSELSSKVPGMISFIEDYYNNYTKELKSLKDSGLSKLKNLFSKKKSGDKDDHTEENITAINNVIVATINASRNTARDKANDFMVALDGLAKGNKKENNSEGNENSQNSNNNNQNDSNQSSNNGGDNNNTNTNNKS